MTNSERSLIVVAVVEASLLLALVLGYVSTQEWVWLYAAGAVVAVFFFLYLRMIMAIKREKASLASDASYSDLNEKSEER